MNQVVRTTCPYCGVGCGVLASVDHHGAVSVRGDTEHPANLGRLCSKGSALGETLGLEGRLLHPVVQGQQVSWDQALDTVAARFGAIIAQHGPEAVAFYVSGQLLTEDYYLANKLMKGYIGSANIDTNSRLCMSSSVAGHKRAFGADAVPCCYEDLERAKLIVLTGANTAWCHPVLFQRMVQAKKDNPDLLVVVIDPRRTPSCDIADLHLPLRSGTDAVLFNGLLNYLAEKGEINEAFVANCTEGMAETLATSRQSVPSLTAVAARCGLSEEQVTEFYRLFARTERVVTVYSQGINQSSSGSDKVNAIINCHLLTGRIGRPGMGPFSFTGQPNAMGGREVGGLANQLAAHMEIENPEHRATVQRFWRSPRMAEQAGLKAVELFEAIAAGTVKAVWIMATNPVVSLPDANRVRAALAQCEFVVVSDCMAQTDTTAHADVLLPALTWAEKDGTVTNSERRISRQRGLIPAPGEAKADWWIIAQVAQRMGYAGFAYQGAHDIFAEHAALSGFENTGQRDFDISGLAGLDKAAFDALTPVQWPVTATRRQGTARLFTDGRFFTSSGKARFIPITPQLPVNAPDENFPLILNTGRVRDQWHTMTRTGKAPRLTEHSPEPYVELHAADAQRFGVSEGALVRVFSRWGEIIVRTRISEAQPAGTVFVPMHWNDQFASCARVDTLVNPVVDPLSGQPELKHTPVRIQSYTPAWHGFLLSRRAIPIHDASYWARASGPGYYRYELAGEQVPGDWPAWARSMLCSKADAVNWVEYLDVGARQYRGVRMVGDRLESCIFIAPGHELPPRSWLAGLFEKAALESTERLSLLTGKPPRGQQDTGRVVCSCFSVGETTLRQLIHDQGLRTPEQIGQACRAGTNCGSCVPELKALLAAQR